MFVFVIIVGCSCFGKKEIVLNWILCRKRNLKKEQSENKTKVSYINHHYRAVNILNEVVKDYSEQLTIIISFTCSSFFYDRMALG